MITSLARSSETVVDRTIEFIKSLVTMMKRNIINKNNNNIVVLLVIAVLCPRSSEKRKAMQVITSTLYELVKKALGCYIPFSMVDGSTYTLSLFCFLKTSKQVMLK